MWCKQCRQDVPGAAAADQGQLCCPRCGEGLSAQGSVSAPPAAAEDVDREDSPTPPDYDGWELDERLRHVDRVLKKGKVRDRQTQAALRQEIARFDLGHGDSPKWHPATEFKPAARRGKAGKESSPSHPVLSVLIWTALSLGTMTLVCGGILLGWSIFAGRPELRAIGTPIVLGGQIALLAGLLLQLDRLWLDSRRAASKLHDVDEQLHDLKTTTTMLGTGNHSPGSAFYSHLADGAGPQLLLTDLKSQLDLLALKMSQNEQF